MNITLFGGAFNPPHLGHLFVIEQAFELIPDLEELWLVPAYKHTFQKKLAPTQHRLQMTNLLLKEVSSKSNKRVKLSTIEIDNQLSGETHDTLQILNEKFPSKTFSFLMGSDNIRHFKKWGNWKRLIEQLHFYIYPRAGFRNQKLFPNMSLLESDTQVITNLSSTLIRKRIREKNQISHFLPQSILKYLRVNRIY